MSSQPTELRRLDCTGYLCITCTSFLKELSLLKTCTNSIRKQQRKSKRVQMRIKGR
nr:MAG TPA: hypothetical protein [Caudoviricetes sp.]